MTKYTLTTAIISVAITLMFLLSGCDSKAFSVNEIASDPAAFKGTITITGIMAGVSPQEPKIFGIMDIKELQCKTQNCNKLFVPVTCQGTQPVPGDEVRLTGSFVNKGGGYLFVADLVKVVRNHKLGG